MSKFGTSNQRPVMSCSSLRWSKCSIPSLGTHLDAFGLISTRNAIRCRNTGPSGPMPGVPKRIDAPACSNAPPRMPASPSIVYGIGGGSLTPAEIVQRSSPSNATSRWSRPIGPIAASWTPKCSGSWRGGRALPGVTTIGWSEVGAPNWAGSATRSPSFDEVLSAANSAVAAVIFRPLRSPVGSKPVRWMPSFRPHENAPLSSVAGAPLAVTVTPAPLLAIGPSRR